MAGRLKYPMKRFDLPFPIWPSPPRIDKLPVMLQAAAYEATRSKISQLGHAAPAAPYLRLGARIQGLQPVAQIIGRARAGLSAIPKQFMLLLLALALPLPLPPPSLLILCPILAPRRSGGSAVARADGA